MRAGLRKRFFAWILKKGDSYNDAQYGEFKRDLLTDLSGTIVEIGPGSGVNFKYFPEGIKWLGVEPNDAFHDVLLQKADIRKIDAKILIGDASQIPLPNGGVDIVVCSLVLCSVPDPSSVIQEIKRILKPGGKFIFIEHVAAPEGSFLRAAQNFSNPINQLMADGCHCNRETWKHLESAGFSKIQLNHHRLKAALKIHAPHIMGFAIK